MYEWRTEYALGIDEIDEQHQRLIEIANRVYAVLHDQWRLDKFNQILEVLDELKNYTVYHFTFEEAYMEKIGYKKRFSHAMEHNAFVEKLKTADLREIDDEQEKYLNDLLDFIAGWIVNHIMTTDKLYTQKQ